MRLVRKTDCYAGKARVRGVFVCTTDTGYSHRVLLLLLRSGRVAEAAARRSRSAQRHHAQLRSRRGSRGGMRVSKRHATASLRLYAYTP